MDSGFFERGWRRFTHDAALARWAAHALPHARAAVEARENAEWLRCGGTWFAGVNVLNNNEAGALPGGADITDAADGAGAPGGAVDFIRTQLGLADFAWDRAQVSVCYPGYPKPWAGESEAAFNYRKTRDAAHVDGLLRNEPERRRFLREHHGFILGLPLSTFDEGAAPFTVWDGSHEIVRRGLAARLRLSGAAPETWAAEDVTEAYHACRREVFETCARTEIYARPGEAFLVHRLALHGTAPWKDGARADADGRMIAYFRPPCLTPDAWLTAA
ncbi:MAG: hypothetical protein ACYYKD_07530 [Rhodospirillales bacterium]